MGKRAGSAVLEMLWRDPRLKVIPLASQAVWVRLMLAMQELGSSVVRFGSDVPNLRVVSPVVV